MHDPMTVAFEIPVPFSGRRNDAGGWEEYPDTLVRIWHVDPETDGSDDSCGWFMRSRHGDQKVLEEIKHAFRFDYDYLFSNDGSPKYSAQAITLSLFWKAAFYHFKKDWKPAKRYMNNNLFDILFFAENPTDSLYGLINQKTPTAREDEQKWNELATIIYPYILRDIRPWYKHPRWHFWHWKIKIPPIQYLKRFLFSRCGTCGKGFKYGEAPTSSGRFTDGPQWFRSEKEIYHSGCFPERRMVEIFNDAVQTAKPEGDK
jgi:hypothetical protein